MKDVRFFGLRAFGLIFLAIAAVAVSACTDSRGGTIPYNVSSFGTPDMPSIQMLPSKSTW